MREAENEWIRSENVPLARELQGLKGSPSPYLMRSKMEVEDLTGNSSSSVSDGCLNFDVANHILVMLEEIPVYVSYIDAKLRCIWSDDSMSDFKKDIRGRYGCT